MPVTGVLRSLALFPVKSLPGLTPRSAAVGPDGLVGDRGFAVVDAAGEVLAAKRHPRLEDLVLAGPPHEPRVEVPGGVPLAQYLQVPGAHVAPVAGGARQVEALHLVSLRQRAAPDGGDSRRANLVVEFGEDEPPTRDWAGAVCAVGDVQLQVVGVPRHCAGVFARVLTPGSVRTGDVVRLSVSTGG
ncbi:MOSC N-terminal beta barrel domain-containing protein [Kineococcus sp. SYSU DK003]|uniref:MOSC N-terminal beta barrel domain-containing protein n=1 Tax=Kineococcus sp. SYSU DK003 TaxID=3383124 RepID=UPI003D7DC2A3